MAAGVYLVNRFFATKRVTACYQTGPQDADRLPTSSKRGKAGRNHLNEEITPLLPTAIGELFWPNRNNLGHAALQRSYANVRPPYKRK